MAATKKGGLGRGLDALFADVPVRGPANDPVDRDSTADETDAVKYIKVHDITPNVNQPRKIFNEEKLDELALSIKENGIIQPIVVRKKSKGYEIVAGERRWRASIKAGLDQVPCLIRELSDEQNMLIAIIENMQREDLNPIEEAEGLRQMTENFGLTQEQVSKSVGKSRPYITNSMRLLKLPDYIRESVADGRLSAAHGRTLVPVEDENKRRTLWEKIISEGLSVRETEALASQTAKPKKRPAVRRKDPDAARTEEELKAIFGTKVTIGPTAKKGKIEIDYYSPEELNRLIDMLKTLG